MKTARIDHLTVVSPDGPAAARTFARLFGLVPAPGASEGGPLAIGDARLEFVSPAPDSALGEALESGGEGLAALTLMVEDLADARRTLAAAGVRVTDDTVSGRAALAVDPRDAHGVRLTLIARP